MYPKQFESSLVQMRTLFYLSRQLQQTHRKAKGRGDTSWRLFACIQMSAMWTYPFVFHETPSVANFSVFLNVNE